MALSPFPTATDLNGPVHVYFEIYLIKLGGCLRAEGIRPVTPLGSVGVSNAVKVIAFKLDLCLGESFFGDRDGIL